MNLYIYIKEGSLHEAGCPMFNQRELNYEVNLKDWSMGWKASVLDWLNVEVGP